MTYLNIKMNKRARKKRLSRLRKKIRFLFLKNIRGETLHCLQCSPFVFLRMYFSRRMRFMNSLKQSYLIGNKSLPLVGITGFIMGLVLTIQSAPYLNAVRR